MAIGTNSFRGEVPLVTPRALPDNAAQLAMNARLQTGDLESWRQFLLTQALANTGTVRTIHLMNDIWLSWNDQVDVARGLIPGDTTYRTFLTCPSLYGRPQFTNYALASTGAAPYPVTTRPLGVDAPEVAPTLAVGVDTSDAANFTVDVLDEGDRLAEDWISYGGSPHLGDSSVQQNATYGNPAQPSYLVIFGRNAGVPAVLYRDFGVANAAAIQMEFRFMFRQAVGGNTWRQMVAKMANTQAGQGVLVSYATGGTFNIATSGGWNTTSASALVSDNGGDPAFDTWFRCRIGMIRNADNTQTVTATLLTDADVVLATVTTTNTFDVGGFCGFVGETGQDDSDSGFFTYHDHIHVTASGTLGYAPVNTATAYVFTYENDLAQQSAPSPVTETILRPDGVSVTVTTPTTLPTGYSVYGIVNKIIYRLVSGIGGTVFKKVASIPVATADYLDVLADEETGPEVLESDDWDLPPAELEGIIALPNDCMAGFFKNQLCFSAQGFPHAWPVKFRLTVDTDIVAIANIDTTVVVGTKSFVYTATGQAPGAYSMSQPGEAQSCVSKLGMKYLDGVGVVFPSPDGYQVCRGSAGAVDNLTAKTFTRRQWEALNPSSIIAAVHDGVLHWFYDNDALQPPLWLDTFTGTGGSGIYSHAQDTPINGSSWTLNGTDSEAVLSGSGSARVPAASASASGADTYFNRVGPTPFPIYLESGWRLELDVTVNNLTEVFFTTAWCVFTLFADDSQTVITFKPTTAAGALPVVTIASGNPVVSTDYTLVRGANRLSIVFTNEGYTLTLNDVEHASVETVNATIAPTQLRFKLGVDWSGGAPVAGGSGTLDRAAIYGQFLT